MPVKLQKGVLTLQIIADASVLAVYVNEGEAILTHLVFPTSSTRSLELLTEGDLLYNVH